MSSYKPFVESPFFRYKIPAGLGVGAVYQQNYEGSDKEESHYSPFNYLFLNNAGSQIGELQLFTSQLKKDVLGGQSVELSNVEFIGWLYKNTDTVVTAKPIEILVRKQLTELELQKQILSLLESRRKL